MSYDSTARTVAWEMDPRGKWTPLISDHGYVQGGPFPKGVHFPNVCVGFGPPGYENTLVISCYENVLVISCYEIQLSPVI